MFPLKTRKITGYKFGLPTFYSKFHLGVDYGTEGLEVFAPFDGQIVFRGVGKEGGNTLWFKPDNRPVVMRFLHLSQFLVKQGQRLKAGQIMAITGYSGKTDPVGPAGGHLHLDISKNKVILTNTSNFIDPEKFDWGENMAQIKTQAKGASRRIVIEAANQNEWEVLAKVYGKDKDNPEENVKDN